MPHDPITAGSRRRGRLLRWAERLLLLAGSATLIWCALLLSDAKISQRAARRALEIATFGDTSTHPDGTTGVVPRPPSILRGSVVADLSIPRVRLSAVVLHGSDDQTLRRGPGHLENTSLPGEPGNVVIAGHRDTFFRPLRNIRLGDDIRLNTPGGRFDYRVIAKRVVKSRDLSVLEPTDHEVLTLITCYPFWVLGPAPDRFVVRATRVLHPVVTAVAKRTLPARAGRPASKESALNTRTGHDDEALVRQAIERFRLTYNARLLSRGEIRPGGPLKFHTCRVAIGGDRGEGTCRVSSQPPDDSDLRLWTFRLARDHAGWAIRSIEVE